MKKFVFLAIAVLIIGALSFQIYRKIGKKEGYERQRSVGPVAVKAEPVERIMLQDTGEFFGSLMPNAQFVVSPKVGGKLQKLYADVGDTVSRGELIAEMEDEEAAQQVEQANAELEVARASLEDSQNALILAQREYDRVKSLFDKQIASAAERDRAETEKKTAEARYRVSLAQIKQKEAALKAAEIRLSYTKIRATWNEGGETRVIGERFVDEGALLKANDPIVTVLDIETLQAVIQVIEKDYPRLHEGQRAVVTTDLFPEMKFEAKVARVAPILKEYARQAQVSVQVPNPGRHLKPGMFVRVKIEFARTEDATVVPQAALVRRNGEQGVFLIDSDEKHVSFVPVRVGIIYEGHAQILDPPLSGMVITLGNHLLEDGSTVMLSPEGDENRPSQSSPSKAPEKAPGGTSR